MSTIRKQSLLHHLKSAFSSHSRQCRNLYSHHVGTGNIGRLFVSRCITDQWVSTHGQHSTNANPTIQDQIKLTFSFLGLAISIKAFLGPIIGMLVVLFSRAHAKSSPLNINSAINFIVKRYKNVFMPYLLAMLSIQVGMLIVIPGIMFMMQYAFVDSVATLEKEKHVLTQVNV